MDHKLNLELPVADTGDRDPWINLAACERLVEFSLHSAPDRLYPASDRWYLTRHRFSQHIQSYSALLSTIGSPDFHIVQLPFNNVYTDDLARDLVKLEEWDHLEDVLLELSRKCRNTIWVGIALSGGVRLLPDCDGFMPRFQEVGEIGIGIVRVDEPNGGDFS